MKNADIRMMIAGSGLLYKDIARQIGITPTSLSRLMRYELSAKDRLRIVNAVQALQEKGSENGR